MTNPIPAAALDKHIGVLGTTGSGKTSAAKTGIVEPALEAGERVLIIDPTGAWWGLRLSASGKRKGFQIYIFGGDHGDYPLRAKDAEILAETFGTSSDSAIFDTSLMTVAERTEFFTQFAEAIRRKNKGPLKIIIDEAHIFMPQSGAKSGGAVPAMLHAGNNLVSLGRSRGLRITLISQRPAKLHKDSLTQVQSLIAMRLIAPQDRHAISDWVEDQADPVRGKEIIASLPSLKPGDAWVWAPLQGMLERVHFALPKTFDSSKAPGHDSADAPVLSPINLDTLKARLASVEAEVKANDPRALKAEITRLNALLRQQPAPVDTGSIRAEGYTQAIGELAPLLEKANKATANVQETLTAMSVHVKQPAKTLVKPITKPVAVVKTNGSATTTLTGPQKVMLEGLAWWAAMGHDTITRAQLAAKIGWKVSGGHFLNRIGELARMGFIAYPRQNAVALTDEGRAVAPEPNTSTTLVESVRASLTGPQTLLFNKLLEDGKMTRDDLATGVGWDAKGGHFLNRIGELARMEIITYPNRGEVALQDWIGHAPRV